MYFYVQQGQAGKKKKKASRTENNWEYIRFEPFFFSEAEEI
jgi:hypothetical protein